MSEVNNETQQSLSFTTVDWTKGMIITAADLNRFEKGILNLINNANTTNETIAGLDYSDSSAADTKFVSQVTETDGQIAVTHRDFAPSISIVAATSEQGENNSDKPRITFSVGGNSATSGDINTATTGVYGVTKLSSAIDSDSEVLAATPKAVKDAIDTASNYTNTAISTLKGANSGLAELDASGHVPANQLPSYVDDVIEGYYDNEVIYSDASHTTPIEGESGKIYVDLSTGDIYRWSGSIFALISTMDISGKADKEHTVLTTTLSRGRIGDAGTASIAFGESVTASGNYSVAIGHTNTASGTYSFAQGFCNIASGSHSAAIGAYLTATGDSSFVFGQYNKTDTLDSWTEWNAETSYVVGDRVKVTTETAVKGYVCRQANINKDPTDPENYYRWTQRNINNYVEIVGNGNAWTPGVSTSNARALDWYGNEYLQGDLYVHCNASSTGGYKVLTPKMPVIDDVLTLGRNHTITGANYSIVAGTNCTVSAESTFAFGWSCQATDKYAFACGDHTKATAEASYATGRESKANGIASHVEGHQNIADGKYSHVEGTYNVSKGKSSHIFGEYNVIDDYDSIPMWDETVAYKKGDQIRYTANDLTQSYTCIENNTGVAPMAGYSNNKWAIDNRTTYVEIVGGGYYKGTPYRANIRALDWRGNEYLAGSLHINCNTSSTGGIIISGNKVGNTLDGIQVSDGTNTVTFTMSELAALKTLLNT